jgi:hypothetical protein
MLGIAFAPSLAGNRRRPVGHAERRAEPYGLNAAQPISPRSARSYFRFGGGDRVGFAAASAAAIDAGLAAGLPAALGCLVGCFIIELL